jgi:hypothetical protein
LSCHRHAHQVHLNYSHDYGQPRNGFGSFIAT